MDLATEDSADLHLNHYTIRGDRRSQATSIRPIGPSSMVASGRESCSWQESR